MPQLSYSLYQFAGMEGSVATAEPTVIRTGVNSTVNDIPNGRILVQGATESDVALPSAAGQTPIGISVVNRMKESATNGALTNPPRSPMNRLVRGSVWMVFENDALPGATLHYRHTANGTPGQFDRIGRLRSGADGALTTALPQARLEQPCRAGQACEVIFNLN